jgi:3-mercaptopyruvate sulfurtransferase SseA
VARALRDSGREAVVIEGGLAAWRKSGLPVEHVPAEDVVQLPTFARPARV